jgi:hypothetical protein
MQKFLGQTKVGTGNLRIVSVYLFLSLFTYGVFNDNVSSSDYTVLTDCLTTNYLLLL